MSQTYRSSERFRLHTSRLAARILAAEAGLFGFDCSEDEGMARSITARFMEAVNAGAIIAPGDARMVVYPLGPRQLIVAVRESRILPGRSGPPARQVATCGFDADEIARPGDATFDACADGLLELTERANDLLPYLRALGRADRAAA
jgi:hypothetical protein